MNKPNDVNVLSMNLSKFELENPYSKRRYDNFINGNFVAPKSGEYFDNVTPVTGQVFCKIARSGAEDIEAALASVEASGKG